MRADSCCDLSRRTLLKGMILGGLATTFGTTVVTTAPSYGAGAPAESVLVVLSLRGAADGLSLVVPHGDPIYAKARPTIAVPRAGLLGADAFFGLHPALSPLLPMWNAGEIAAVHATGMAVPNRSHFAAMELVEDAAPGSSTRSGWLNRMLGGTDPLQSLAIGAMPAALYGEAPAMSLSSLANATLSGEDSTGARAASLRSMWAGDATPMGHALTSALTALGELAPAKAQPETAYPDTDLGRALSSVARTLRADLGVGVITVDQGDWDMHTNLGTPSGGAMATNTGDLAKALAIFFGDLGPARSKVTVVTISEFGRRVVENASRGLDHGWGNVMFVMGAGIRGGYYARWTPLANTTDADLAVTTDYRDVLAEVVSARSPSASLATVFPGFTPTPIGFMTGASGWGRTTTTVPITPTQPTDAPSTPVAPATPHPGGGSTMPAVLTAASVGRPTVTGLARAGRTVSAHASAPRGATIALAWILTPTKGRTTTVGHGRSLKLKRAWKGGRLQLRVTWSSPGQPAVVTTITVKKKL